MADQSDSHKERAYIAASRRHDRGIEARLESARQASKIHKKRTGRALRISEEIILGDAAYEEEEIPRRRQLSGSPLMQTAPWQGEVFPNNIAGASAQSQMFTEKEWRENMVNQAFSQAFPQLDARLSQRWPAQYFIPREHVQRGQFRSSSTASSNISSQSGLSSQLVDGSNSEQSSPIVVTSTAFPGRLNDGGDGSLQ